MNATKLQTPEYVIAATEEHEDEGTLTVHYVKTEGGNLLHGKMSAEARRAFIENAIKRDDLKLHNLAGPYHATRNHHVELNRMNALALENHQNLDGITELKTQQVNELYAKHAEGVEKLNALHEQHTDAHAELQTLNANIAASGDALQQFAAAHAEMQAKGDEMKAHIDGLKAEMDTKIDESMFNDLTSRMENRDSITLTQNELNTLLEIAKYHVSFAFVPPLMSAESAKETLEAWHEAEEKQAEIDEAAKNIADVESAATEPSNEGNEG